ncbi:MAG: HD domain-containing protein [Candidatus Eisenbacteria bacterium]|nr:HD domain-containing protein [Candidatus Eisenbacteria bacterium]
MLAPAAPRARRAGGWDPANAGEEMDHLVRFLFEVGHLKQVVRSGWWMAGVRDPESVAEHSFRCAWIGWLLAQQAGADPGRVTLMCLLNDLHEARIGDAHKIAQTYLDYGQAETRALHDQVRPLPQGKELAALHDEFQAGETLEAQLARDADRLECAFQAREYMASGHGTCVDWLENTRRRLATEAGGALFRALAASDPHDWMRRLPRQE